MVMHQLHHNDASRLKLKGSVIQRHLKIFFTGLFDLPLLEWNYFWLPL